MNAFVPFDLFYLACAARRQWGLWLSVSEGDVESDTFLEDVQAATLLDGDALSLLLGGGKVVLFFDTENECNAVYNNIVGDDGPTATNPYNGPVRVFATTCNPKGSGQRENT